MARLASLNKSLQKTQTTPPAEAPANAVVDDSDSPHNSFPPIVDNGQRPDHTYSKLISMAILRSRDQQLTLADIYTWISNTYKFYKPKEKGWRNCIRHNLSRETAFVKVERSKDDPGKGNYWKVQGGRESQFHTRKSSRRHKAAIPGPGLSPSKPSSPTPQANLPTKQSSDAVFNQAAPEDVYVHSLPCTARQTCSGFRTPPAVQTRRTSSIDPSRKRKACASPTSEADRPRTKRCQLDDKGRAEIEIARLRASSERGHSTGRPFNVFRPVFSSLSHYEDQTATIPKPAGRFPTAIDKAPVPWNPDVNFNGTFSDFVNYFVWYYLDKDD